MDISLPECPCLPLSLKFAARLKPWRQALALPEDAGPVLGEIVKFLGTLALILVTGLMMLMAG